MMHIACAADEAYAPHAAAMMHSLISHHTPADVCIHFLHEPQLPGAVVDRLRSMTGRMGAGLCFHSIPDDDVAGLPDMGRISRVMWYRIFLPRLLPDVERVLYLDCDTIVMDDLRPLFATDLRDACLGAVANVFEAGREGRVRGLGLDGPEQYFNSGVLLLNLDQWRREDSTARLLAHARANASRLAWPDQDALNVIFARRWRALHPRWNCQNSLFYFDQARAVFGAPAVLEAKRRPGILHFEGGELAKPWHYLCKHPFRGEYYRHLAATPWPVQPPQGRTVRNRLLRPLPMRLLLPTLRWLHRFEAGLRRRLARVLPAQ